MPQIGLQATGIDALVRKCEAAGMPKHVRMDRELEPGGNAQAGDQLAKPAGAEGCSPFRGEHEGAGGFLIALEAAQSPQFTAAEGVDGWAAALGPVHVEAAVGEVDLSQRRPTTSAALRPWR